MRVIACDAETVVFSPGNMVPPLVCLSWHEAGTVEPGLAHVMDGAVEQITEWLEDPNVITVWQNGTGYDLAVIAEAGGERSLRAVISALDGGRVRDTQLREYLIAVRNGQRQQSAKGYYSLAGMAQRYLGLKLEKEDTWRLRYGELISTPLDQWPPDAVSYAQLDASTTLRVAIAQQQALELLSYEDLDAPVCAVTEREQCKAAFALHVISAWGIRTDGAAVKELAESLTADIVRLEPELVASGVLRRKSKRKPDLSRDMKLIRARIEEGYRAAELEVPLTDGGQTATGQEVIDAVSGHCPELSTLSGYLHAQKLLGTFVAAAAQGVDHPIHARFNPVMATNRTSCGKPNLQNLPQRDGVRRCFVPRPGYVFSSEDYSTLEMRTHAQVLLDWGFHSKLALAFQTGGASADPHMDFGKRLVEAGGLEWGALNDDERKAFRQRAKVCNFGYPGGLGAQSMVAYAKAYRLTLTATEAKRLKAAWLGMWPEMRQYFDKIAAMEVGGFIDLEMPRTGMIRGGCWYTQACNYPFQGLAAAGAKAALYAVASEALQAKPGDPLWDVHVVNFIHDEIMAEHPEETAARGAARIAEIMVEVMQQFTPDIPHFVEPTLMRRWDKKAKPQFDDNGTLIPWDAT